MEIIIGRLPTEVRNPQLSAVCQFLNGLIAERDWSAQEVTFLLDGNSLVDCSRTFRYVDRKLNRATSGACGNVSAGMLENSTFSRFRMHSLHILAHA
jgi:hypothetical protein